LNRRHATKDEKAERAEHESAMTPRTLLKIAAPASLKRHVAAKATWKRIVSLYFEVEGQIVTAFDQDLLVKYCLLEEECVWLEGIRRDVEAEYRICKANAKRAGRGADLKIYFSAVEQMNALLARLQGMDARLDGKRKLVHALAQSLYLTPRSRAGVAPTEKEEEKPMSETEKALG
jgi:phage terminase small subunit